MTNEDLKQLFEYYKPEFCKNEENAQAIFIVISKAGEITEYNVANMKFCPTIIKTKLINKQKDLKVIRDKFENNKTLNSRECSMMIAFPLFELGESEDAIVEEMCNNIAQKSHCIPDFEIDQIVMGMYLNIVEYTAVEMHKELVEMIDVERKTEGVIKGLINQGFGKGRDQGFGEGRKSIVDHLFENHSAEEVAERLELPLTEVLDMIKR